ncbi:MAG: glycosyltransferase family 4 protein [Candidatus Rokuibacteriota bacterium]|nr:MAG: glycosyltransferase family 4 protein [Candidatus Rokubacteria bacterium]
MAHNDPARADAHRPARVLAPAVGVTPALADAGLIPGARVALVHDWLTGMRGGERCLEVLCELFPDAPLFTLLHVPGSVTTPIERRRIVTSFVQRLPRASTRYRYYLPTFPLAISRFDLSGYDVIVSMSHCVAKGVRVPPGALHLCYCFSPMRYVWDLSSDYFGPGHGLAARVLGPPIAAALRRWDRRTSGVHRFVAISRHIGDRIRRAYDRSADVIYPPVDVQRFEIADAADDYYLVVGALVPYKRIDLAVGAANRLGRRLVIVGTGPEDARLRALAGPTVSFLGWQPDAEIARLYARCRALIFPAVEDFGITPLEAAAAGRPTLALARGGALETMVGSDVADAPPTAVFFAEQTVDALVEAIERFERAADRFDAKALRARAESFDRPIFKQKLGDYIAARWGEFRARAAC